MYDCSRGDATIKTKRLLIAVNVLVIAILACSAPGGLFNPPDAAATNTALAGTLQAAMPAAANKPIVTPEASAAGSPQSLPGAAQQAGNQGGQAAPGSSANQGVPQCSEDDNHCLNGACALGYQLNEDGTCAADGSLGPLDPNGPATGNQGAQPVVHPLTPGDLGPHFTCTKVGNVYKIHAVMSWSDRADNEAGYKVEEIVYDAFGATTFDGTTTLSRGAHIYTTDRQTSAIKRAGVSFTPRLTISVWAFSAANVDSGKISDTFSCFH